MQFLWGIRESLVRCYGWGVFQDVERAVVIWRLDGGRSVSKMAHSHGWQLCAGNYGCGQETSVPHDVYSVGLPKSFYKTVTSPKARNSNKPCGSCNIFLWPNFRVVHYHFQHVLLVTQTNSCAMNWFEGTTWGHKYEEVRIIGDYLGDDLQSFITVINIRVILKSTIVITFDLITNVYEKALCKLWGSDNYAKWEIVFNKKIQ